jgi:hypothetical protein
VKQALIFTLAVLKLVAFLLTELNNDAIWAVPKLKIVALAGFCCQQDRFVYNYIIPSEESV